jgi:hypothetical protein
MRRDDPCERGRGVTSQIASGASAGRIAESDRVRARQRCRQTDHQPLGAENQVRGAVIDGLAQTLTGQAIEFVDGVVRGHSFTLPGVSFSMHWN